MHHTEEILHKYWGYNDFRPLQKEIIESVLNTKDTLSLLPTGGGKSICYQLPALINEGFCLVVSPLIALMQDQVARLKELDIPAAAIHAGMHYSEVKRTLNNMVHGPFKLLYVSPERLQTDLFRDYLPDFNINLIAVDEAHCISQWGHDFRPDYLKIASIRDIFQNVPVLALTASATDEVREDIIKQLHLHTPAIFKQSFARENIFYEVKYSENKPRDTFEHIPQKESTIIYCRSRKQTEATARMLNQTGKYSLSYHAGMTKEKREAAQQSWMKNETPAIVATTAFGMGIDKPDVRLILHYDAPEHLEAYYQEAGRAGRDNQLSNALLLYNSRDIQRLSDSITLQFPPEVYLRKVYQAVTEYLQIPIGNQPDQYYPFDLADFCKKFSLQATEASYALRLLEQEGLWTLTEAVFHPATIQFTTDRYTLDDICKQYPNLGYIITNLLRIYDTIFQYPTTLRLSAISKQLKLKKEEIEASLQQLKNMQILEYNTPSEGPQLFFHHLRVDSRHLMIDMKRISVLRKRHEARTNAMISFLKNDRECRERIILNYFGEDVQTDCGHCDVCLKKKTNKKIDRKELKDIINQTLQQTPAITLQQLVNNHPIAIREQLITLVRGMIDDKTLNISGNGQITKPNK